MVSSFLSLNGALQSSPGQGGIGRVYNTSIHAAASSYLMKGLLQYTKGESGWGFNVYWLSTCDDG